MKFRTLQFSLSVSVFAFGLVLIVISFSRQYFRDASDQRARVRQSAYNEGSRLSGMAQYFLRKKLSQSADLAVSFASIDPDLRHGFICDGADVVRHSINRQWIGVNLSETPLRMMAPLLAQIRERMEGQVEETEGGARLIAIFPFWDVVGDMSKGAVILDYDLSGALLAARNRAVHESLATSFALLGGCLMLWSLLHVLVTERVVRIVEQTRRIGREAMISESIGGNDELAQVSESITQAAWRLHVTEQQLSLIALSLRDVFWVAPARREEPLYVNVAYEALLGRSMSSLETHRWDWLRSVVKKDRRKALDMLRRLRMKPEEIEIEIRIVDPTDSFRWVSCRGFSMHMDFHTRGSLRVVGVVMDITERKNIEHRMLEVVEQERRRIGQDLHDDVCQRLAAAQLKSGVLQASLSRISLPQAELAGDVARELAEATDIARGYARGLAPVVMGTGELPQVLAGFAMFLQRAFNIHCTASCDLVEGLVDEEDATQIYRIAQELATNAAKHAGASWINIDLMCVADQIRLEVSSDGVLFNPQSQAKSKGMGLHIVRQRVDALGASLSFQPRKASDGGTLVVCGIPIKRNNDLSTMQAI